jgi:hypothetical protein
MPGTRKVTLPLSMHRSRVAIENGVPVSHRDAVCI